MNDNTLSLFRDLADAMHTAKHGNAPRDWEWVGEFLSQRHFGITEERARDFAARFGGRALPMAHEDSVTTRAAKRAAALERRDATEPPESELEADALNNPDPFEPE